MVGGTKAIEKLVSRPFKGPMVAIILLASKETKIIIFVWMVKIPQVTPWMSILNTSRRSGLHLVLRR